MPNPATRTAPGDITAPSTPPSPVVVPFGRGLQVSVIGYTMPSDFLRFRYYKNSVLWRETATPSVIDYDVSYGVTYQYTVAAIDTAFPANASAQSGIGSGVPATIDTPDIRPSAVTVYSYVIQAPFHNLNALINTPVAVPGLAHQHNVYGSGGLLILFEGRWVVQNVTGIVGACGMNASLIRDGSLTLRTCGYAWTLPGSAPGNTGGIVLTMNVVDFPGPGIHTYTVKWVVESETESSSVAATLNDLAMECVELKR